MIAARAVRGQPRERGWMSKEGDRKTTRWKGSLEGRVHGWSLENRESQGCSHRARNDVTVYGRL